MGKARFLFLGVLCSVLTGSSTLVRADGIPVDPVMGVSDPTSCGEGCTAVEGTTFSFFSDQNGGGITQFQNQSGVNWTSLLIDVTTHDSNNQTLPSVPADTITCHTNAFATCQSFDLANGDTAIYLTGVFVLPDDIPNLGFFTINLNDDQSPTGADQGGWDRFRELDATANAPSPVPEPATISLLGVGLGTLLAKRRLRRQRESVA
jgi:PEP-CTERM motif